MVVDTGFGFAPLRPAFPFLARISSIAVATHTHCDHIGGMAEFENRAVHRLEAHVLANPTRAATLLDKALSAESFVNNAPPDGLDITRHEIPAAPATIVLEDGDVIDLGDKCFRTLHVPGHSPGGLALFDEMSGTLFSGDMLHAGPGGIGRYVWHHSCPAEFLESVRRLRDLAPRIILAGHFDPFGLPALEAIVGDYERHHAAAHAGQ
jgi:glyoxylase-like metal-dependent hydrolase (beta-lactamase superfamily II)